MYQQDESAWRRSKPPHNARIVDGPLIFNIVADRPGISFNELLLASGLFGNELVEILRRLVDVDRAVERKGAQFFPRERRKRPPAPPSFWSRLFRRGN